MPNYSAIVKQFWQDMNRHPDASYKKLDACTVIEQEPIPAESDNYTRLVIWSRKSAGKWAKLASIYGPEYGISNLYVELGGMDRKEAARTVKRRSEEDLDRRVGRVEGEIV